jgi:hypothetical protein
MLNSLKNLLESTYKEQVVHRARSADQDDTVASNISKSQPAHGRNSLSCGELRDSGYIPEDKGSLTLTFSLGRCQPLISKSLIPATIKVPRDFAV